MTADRAPTPGGVSLRARALINHGDPRISAVEEQLAPELTDCPSPDRMHYLAAVAVAVLDARVELESRTARTKEAKGRAHQVATGVVVALVLALLAAVVAAVCAGVVALWRAVLS